MPADLRGYLRDLGERLVHVEREVDPLTQLGALCSQSDSPLLFERLRGYPGWRICDILVKTRESQAVALGTEPGHVTQRLSQAFRRGPQPTRPISDAPVQEIVWTGDDVDLRRLPIAVHSVGDSAPYIGGGMNYTVDPDTGIGNVAQLRTQVNHPRRVAFSMAGRHNYRHYQKYGQRDEPMPMAMVIGHHPAYEIAANWSGPYGVDEFALAGALLEETVELVPCKTIPLNVPAHAEIVIEGWVPPNETELEGPFGEFQGYISDDVRPKPVWNVTAITMRRDAIYRHTQATVFTDHQALCSMSQEARLLEQIAEVSGAIEIHDVYVPPWAGNYLVVLQVTPRFEGQAKDALLTALSGSVLHAKVVVAVDPDVDIYDGRDLWWAVATRVNPATDVIQMAGLRNHRLDISIPEIIGPGGHYERIGGRLGIDATKPSLFRPKERSSFNRVQPMGAGDVVLADFLKAEAVPTAPGR